MPPTYEKLADRAQSSVIGKSSAFLDLVGMTVITTPSRSIRFPGRKKRDREPANSTS
jgi:hypothetical protein